MAKGKSRRGESADHLLNFQYRAPPQHIVSPSLGAARSQQRGQASQRGQPFDAEKAKQAYRIQTFQYVLYPDAALCACEGTTATIASQLSSGGGNRTSSLASSSPPQLRGTGSNTFSNNAWSTTTTAPPALTTSTRRAAVSATPQLGKTIAKSMIGFDSLVPWEYVYALVLRHSLSGNDNEFQCPICLEVPCAPRISPCGHVFCLPCILRFLDTQKSEQHQRTCPMCNELLVPKLLKRVLWCPTAPHNSSECNGTEQQEEEFVLVHRDRDSSIILSHDDVHLIEGQRLQREMLSACGSSTNDLPPLVLPRAEDDASWKHSRYCIATEELHNLHQILDISALEERRMELQHNIVRPMPRDDAKELDSIDESMTLVNRYERMYFGTGGAAATPTTAAVPTSSTSSHSMESVRDDTATNRPAAAAASSSTHTTTIQPLQPMSYDLYMSVDGTQRFLHFVCLKMLKDDREARGLPLPSRIRVRVLDVESTTQTDQTRSILKPLAHIPLFGTFQTCFADMSPLVSKHTLRAFQEVVDRRMQRIREQQRLNEERSRHVSSVDDAWEKHKEARRNADPIWKNRADVSPTMQAFAMPLEDLPTLDMLPPSSGSKHSVSSSSTAERSGVSRSAGGPSDSSVETRQRATKGRLEELHDALTMGNLAAVEATQEAAQEVVSSSSTTAAAVSQGGSTCWGGSTAASKLFAQPKGPVVPVKPTWGGSPFVDRSSTTGSWPQPKAQEIDEDELMDDYVDPLDDLFQPRGGGGRYGGLATAAAGGKSKKGSRRGGNTVSLAGTSIESNSGGGGGKKKKGEAPQAAASSVTQQQEGTA